MGLFDNARNTFQRTKDFLTPGDRKPKSYTFSPPTAPDPRKPMTPQAPKVGPPLAVTEPQIPQAPSPTTFGPTVTSDSTNQELINYIASTGDFNRPYQILLEQGLTEEDADALMGVFEEEVGYLATGAPPAPGPAPYIPPYTPPPPPTFPPTLPPAGGPLVTPQPPSIEDINQPFTEAQEQLTGPVSYEYIGDYEYGIDAEGNPVVDDPGVFLQEINNQILSAQQRYNQLYGVSTFDQPPVFDNTMPLGQYIEDVRTYLDQFNTPPDPNALSPEELTNYMQTILGEQLPEVLEDLGWTMTPVIEEGEELVGGDYEGPELPGISTIADLATLLGFERDKDGNLIIDYDNWNGFQGEFQTLLATAISATDEVRSQILEAINEFGTISMPGTMDLTGITSAMENISASLLAGPTEENMQQAREYMAGSLGFDNFAEYQNFMETGSLPLSEQQGLSPQEREMRERNMRIQIRQQEERARMQAEAVLGQTGMTSHMLRGLDEMNMQIADYSLQQQMAIENENFARQALQFEAQNNRYNQMIQSGQMAYSEYMNMRQEALNSALIPWMEAADLAIEQYGTEANVVLSQVEALNQYINIVTDADKAMYEQIQNMYDMMLTPVYEELNFEALVQAIDNNEWDVIAELLGVALGGLGSLFSGIGLLTG